MTDRCANCWAAQPPAHLLASEAEGLRLAAVALAGCLGREAAPEAATEALAALLAALGQCLLIDDLTDFDQVDQNNREPGTIAGWGWLLQPDAPPQEIELTEEDEFALLAVLRAYQGGGIEAAALAAGLDGVQDVGIAAAPGHSPAPIDALGIAVRHGARVVVVAYGGAEDDRQARGMQALQEAAQPWLAAHLADAAGPACACGATRPPRLGAAEVAGAVDLLADLAGLATTAGQAQGIGWLLDLVSSLGPGSGE
jgi:hypothetical protein